MKRNFTLSTCLSTNVLSFFPGRKNKLAKSLLLFVFLSFAGYGFAQNTDSVKNLMHIKGAVSFMNKGISIIPTFTLDKPAVGINLSVSRGNLSFDPELRFAIDGKPWGFVFWWRYKVINTGRFTLGAGAHPAIAYKTTAVVKDGVSKNVSVGKHFVAGELSPNYRLSKNTSVGMYYLYGHGMEKETIRNTHFITLNSRISNIRLSNGIFLGVIPQVYYLKMDDKGGYYFTSAFSVAKRNFPLTVSAVINKTIQTDITASKDFVWNVSLNYSFSKKIIGR